MQVTTFGEIDGGEIKEIALTSASGASASIITWGAVIRDLVVPAAGGSQRVVLGLNSLDDYRHHSPHFGAVPGRFANRIGGGRFAIDGKSYQLAINEFGRNTLHGGPRGFGTLPWSILDVAPHAVTLVLDSPDGDMGFPGALRVTCTYSLIDAGTLRVDLAATSDAPTVVTLAQHSYFNLDGGEDILDHEVTIPSRLRIATDAELIPTGEIVSIDGTPWDFRLPRPVRHASGQTYDLAYVIEADPEPETGLAFAARARSLKNGLTLDVHTDQAAIQFYDAAKLDCPVPGLGGAHYGAHAGLCFEAQDFPDAPNHRHFPSSVLRPGGEYRQRTEYRFIA